LAFLRNRQADLAFSSAIAVMVMATSGHMMQQAEQKMQSSGRAW
jgi:hypothetical protein